MPRKPRRTKPKRTKNKRTKSKRTNSKAGFWDRASQPFASNKQALEFFFAELKKLGVDVESLGKIKALRLGFLLENVNATAQQIRDGLDVLLGIMNDPRKMQVILKRAYIKTVVASVQRAWKNRLLRQDAEGEALGSFTGSYGVPQSYLAQLDPAARKRHARQGKSFARPKGGRRKDRDYRNQVLAISEAFARTLVIKGNTISLRPMKYYAQNFQLSGGIRGQRISTGTRPFKSAFMIHEFGTGKFAKPAPRLFQNPKTTPWKVPHLFGGDAGEWVPLNPAARIMRRQYQDILANKRNEKGYLVLHKPFSRWREVIQSGRRGAHVFTTEARGIIKEHRALIQKFKIQVIQDLIAAVKKEVPEFDLLLVPAERFPEAFEFTSTI
jgi:hypothetical protein